MTYYDLITLPLSLLGINTVILWLSETSGDIWDLRPHHARHINHGVCQASDYRELQLQWENICSHQTSPTLFYLQDLYQMYNKYYNKIIYFYNQSLLSSFHIYISLKL